MITLVYLRLPLLTRLPMFTCVYLCLPLFTRIYLPLLVFTCLLVFTYVYSCYLCLPLLLAFTYVYSCLPLFIRNTPTITIVAACINADTGVGPSIASGNHMCNHCLYMFTPVYSCLLMFTLVYRSLHLFTRVYLGLLLFTYVNSCLPIIPFFTHVDLYLLVFT